MAGLINIPNAVVMEFGVSEGTSTAMFSDILKEKGHLISVDIRDCSKVIENWEGWKFIQCDDRDINKIISNSIMNGIIFPIQYDLIYVDSFCYNIDAYQHMNDLFKLWIPRIKKNGYMVIRGGIDPQVYEKGGRKEDKRKAEMYTKVRNSVLEFYYKNEYHYDLELCMGGCGMAFLKKLI
jgi:hypothetical protein